MSQKKKIAPPFSRSAIGFLPEYLDFQKGIHVGNLQENQRITRILKLALEARYQESFVTERYGRGVYWQWIGFLPRSNRDAKPISSKVSFGCSKFYLTIDTDGRLFKCGFSVERGMIRPPANFPKIGLKSDWDWHRLLQSLTPSGAMASELKRLVQREGFRVEAGNWENNLMLDKNRFPSMASLKKALESAAPAEWAGFQVFYPMPEKEVQSSSGVDLVESMMAIFDEVTPAMNLCMQIQLK
jgi:hypothetical protein